MSAVESDFGPWADDRPVAVDQISPRQALIQPMLARYFEAATLAGLPDPDGPALTVTEIGRTLPGALAGLQVGDRVAAIDGWRVRTQREYDLVRLLADQDRDRQELIVRRAGKTLSIVMNQLLPEYVIGFSSTDDFDTNDQLGATAANVQPAMVRLAKRAGLPIGADTRLWASFPRRPLLAAATWQRANPKASTDWLSAFIAWHPLIAAQRFAEARAFASAHPALQRSPIPEWQRLVIFESGLSEHVDGTHADPTALGVDPVYYVLHYPHWSRIPEFGSPAFANDNITARLRILHGAGGAHIPAVNENMQALGMDYGIGGQGDYYINCMVLALLDPARGGGRPFRSHVVYDRKDRAQTRATIDAWARTPQADTELAAIALIHIDALDQQCDAVIARIEAMAKRSPFLASLIIGQLQPSMNEWNLKRLRPMIDELARGLDLLPVANAYYQRLASSPALSPWALAPWLGASAAELSHRDASALLSFLGPRSFLARLDDRASSITMHINELAWFFATDERFIDKEALREYHDEMLRFSGRELGADPNQMDTVAAAAAYLGDFIKAVHWQQKAIPLVPKEHKADFELRLQGYRARRPCSVPASVITQRKEGPLTWHVDDKARCGLVEAVHPDGSRALRGFFKDGLRFGPWTAWDPQGQVLAAGSFEAGYPASVWRHYRADGSLHSMGRWHGCGGLHKKPIRFDFWRLYHPDGKTVSGEGWFNEGRATGCWRHWRSDGSLLAFGNRWANKGEGSWTWVQADGSREQRADAPPLDLLDAVIPGEAAARLGGFADTSNPQKPAAPVPGRPVERPPGADDF